MIRILSVLVLLIGTIAAPFFLRPADRAAISTGKNTERLVIITPHNESIMAEFAMGFNQYMQQKFGRKVYIDWRQPGGTTEIALFLKSEYSNAMENLWKAETGKPFTSSIREAFSDARRGKMLTGSGYEEQRDRLRATTPNQNESLQNAEGTGQLAREMFLRSNVGIGVDLFFGGGALDFIRQADAGTLVKSDPSGRYGPAALAQEKPEWFTDSVLPITMSGEAFRDPDFRWVGTVLSAFGICYNKDVYQRLGLTPPEQWDDLADPRLIGQIALADPTKSGSATKAYEMIIQQKIQQALKSMQMQARDTSAIEHDAIRQGWSDAMRMILKISANGRYFTDSASKVPHDVSQGESAAGMCIDFYGRTYNESKRKADGTSRIEFLMPRAGTSIGADPVALLRGAPSPELAHHFIDYCLSLEGQKLWNFRPGTPGGPTRHSLRRPPIRKDFYVSDNIQHMADPDVNPYQLSEGFNYNESWTGKYFNAMRFIIRCACVDTHHEQRRAWQACIAAGMPPAALAEFEDVSAVSYDQLEVIAAALKSKDRIREVELARDLSGHFRNKYRRVVALSSKRAVQAPNPF